MKAFIYKLSIPVFIFILSSFVPEKLYSTDLIFDHERGFYNGSFVLKLTSTNNSAVIKYTTDCTDPRLANAKTYSFPIPINETTIIKAIAYYSMDSSEVITNTFLFPESIKVQPKNPAGFPTTWGGSSTITADYEMDPNVINNPDYSAQIVTALKSLPSLSLTMPIDDWFNPAMGMYVGYPNSDVTREKAVCAEFIYADSTQNFSINCGVQNQGGTSIVNWKVPKESMRLLFKSQYGPKKLKKKLFPDSDIESINTLVVDGMLYSWLHPWDDTQRKTTLYFRDQLAADLQNQMGGLSFHGIYTNVYINGLYWGVYDLHERPDEEFMSEYYDAQPEDFDVIKHNPNTIVSGSNDSYLKLLDQARKGFSSDQSLVDIKKYLDLPSFIDYMVLNFYLGNYDWAHQNYYAAVNKTLGTGYKFYSWDAEHVMRYSDVNYNNTAKNDIGGPTEIHQLLKTNSEYRLMFADAFYKHTSGNGALAPKNLSKAFMNLKNEIDLAVILESARWGDYLESTTNTVYTLNDYWLPEVNKALNNYIPNRLGVVTKQLQSSDNLLYPNVLSPGFSLTPGKVNNDEILTISNSNTASGNIIFSTNGLDPRKTGGDVQGTVYNNNSIKIDKSTFVKARFKSANNEWSALAEAYFIPEKEYGEVAISEIMYNSGIGDMEFLELYNRGNYDVNLWGFSFKSGITYNFENDCVLKPGENLVLANDSNVFHDVYGFYPYGIYTKKLSNSGETILLANYYGETADSVTYSDYYPWPYQADGYGNSLEIIDPINDNALASNWKASANAMGSPGIMNNINSLPTVYQGIEMKVYPCPFHDNVSIMLNGLSNAEDKRLDIYTSQGQFVKSFKIAGNLNVVQLDLSSLSTGIYIFRLSNYNGNHILCNQKGVKI